MSQLQPQTAVSVRVQYGRYVNPDEGVDAPVVFLTFDTETGPPARYALSPSQARDLGRELAVGSAG